MYQTYVYIKINPNVRLAVQMGVTLCPFCFLVVSKYDEVDHQEQ